MSLIALTVSQTFQEFSHFFERFFVWKISFDNVTTLFWEKTLYWCTNVCTFLDILLNSVHYGYLVFNITDSSIESCWSSKVSFSYLKAYGLFKFQRAILGTPCSFSLYLTLHRAAIGHYCCYYFIYQYFEKNIYLED